jgi:hypothetical protein
MKEDAMCRTSITQGRDDAANKVLIGNDTMLQHPVAHHLLSNATDGLKKFKSFKTALHIKQ